MPAHNEESTVGRSLGALRDLAGDVELVVVCNGCTDDTAAAARQAAPWARVVELSDASKPAALRAGDATMTAMPRLYLDADVVLAADGLRRLATVLEEQKLAAVAPTPRYDIAGASAIVRSHYRMWTALNTSVNAIYGTGAMMVSACGRARFGEWPDVIADDYFLDGLFAADEKRRVAEVETLVTLPRHFVACVSRKARVHQGKRDVIDAGFRPAQSGGTAPSSSIVALVRAQPSMAVHVPAHVLVTMSARILSAWRRRRRTAHNFYRDTSSRSS
jgi:glycosyltransferase involved in cell wall biosynthesis